MRNVCDVVDGINNLAIFSKPAMPSSATLIDESSVERQSEPAINAASDDMAPVVYVHLRCSDEKLQKQNRLFCTFPTSPGF